jgi:hypothetical protein
MRKNNTMNQIRKSILYLGLLFRNYVVVRNIGRLDQPMETRSSISAIPVVTTIPNNAFTGDSMISFTVSASTETLGEECFRDCFFLSSVTFARISCLKVIGARSFYKCLSLPSLCIPASVEILGADCFSDCYTLATLTFEKGSQLSQMDTGAFRRCRLLQSIVIPKMIRILKDNCFYACSSLRSVVFESESALETIESEVFSECRALESLALPASLTLLSQRSLCGMPLLKSLIFESGSNLREIQQSAFSGCQSLKSLVLPASLSVIDGSAFLLSSIEEILVDAANPHYFASGPFLVGVDGMTLIRHFGNGGDLEADCLTNLYLRQIGPEAFCGCSALKSILIPAGIEILGDYAFSKCTSLSEIIFEPGSKLTQIENSVFLGCSSLTSICIPANVEKICPGCFFLCTSLVGVSFQSGSKLTLMEAGAFLVCHSLRSLVIPANLEIMASGTLCACISLCELIFELPSHLKQLDLPPSEFGSLCIPDCVEIVFGGIGTRQSHNRILQFGRESCLRELSLRGTFHPFMTDQNTEKESDSFVDLPEGVLRRFRCQFEYW